MKNFTKENKQKGFFRLIGIFVVVVAIITYFNIDVAAIVESDLFQGTLATMKKIVAIAYDFVVNIIRQLNLSAGDTATTTTATTTAIAASIIGE